MDFRHPVQAVVPGAQGKLLGVLAEVSTELSLRRLADLAGVSPPQASRVMDRLVRLGLVSRREAPPAALFRLVGDHVAVRAVVALARSRERLLQELGQSARETLSRLAVSVIVFGSMARGEAGPESDIDVLVVRSRSVGDDDAAWTAAVQRWRDGAVRLSGNPVEVLEVAEADVPGLLASDRPFWRELALEGICLTGASITEVLKVPGA